MVLGIRGPNPLMSSTTFVRVEPPGNLIRNPVTSVTDFFASANPSNPIDRRRVLQFFATMGVGAATTTAIIDTTHTKTTSEIRARSFVPAPETLTALNQLGATFETLQNRTTLLLELHRRLFLRTVRVEWDKQVTTTTEVCSDNGNGTKCHTKTETHTEHDYAARSIYIDDALPNLRHADLNSLLGRYQLGVERTRALHEQGLSALEGALQQSDPHQMNREDFARNFGFEWTEGKVSTGWQTALATAIGIPATALFLFYNRFWKGIGRLIDSDTYGFGQRDEIGPTRRAFLQLVFGGGAAAYALNSGEYYQQRSNRIRDEGESEIRRAIIMGNTWSVEEYFRYYFAVTDQDLLIELRTYINDLKNMTFESVDRAVRHGLEEVHDLESELMASAPFGAYNKQTTQLEDEYNRAAIGQYVATSHQIAGELEGVFESLRNYFYAGVPTALLPVMRAYFMTHAVNNAIGNEHSSHMWGLAGDLGKLYGAALILLHLSEIPGGYHGTIYNIIQGLCDYWDRTRLSVAQVVLGMKKEISPQKKQELMQSPEIQEMVRHHIETLKASAKDLAEIEIIYAPVVSSYLKSLKDQAHIDLLHQIKNLSIEKVIEAYLEKALVFFAKKQLGLEGLREVLRGERKNKDPIVNPSSEALNQKMLELVTDAEPFFIFDLIEAGLINDNEPEEDWRTAEAHELDGYIGYWADRIAGFFGSTQNMYVALEILPKNWFGTNAERESLSRSDVIDAFEKAIERKLNTATKKNKVRQEIIKVTRGRSNPKRNQPDREISTQEISKRLLLRSMREAYERNSALEVLFEFEPRLHAVMATSPH